MDNNIAGKTVKEWIEKLPLIEDVINTNEVFWLNPDLVDLKNIKINWEITKEDIEDAKERLNRFAPYIAKVFPETSEKNGIIESPLKDISDFKSVFNPKIEKSPSS